METNIAPAAHITLQTALKPAVRAWELFLLDQGRSPYTIKAFVGDLQLLANYLPVDRSIGSITTNDINHFLGWLQAGRGIPCSPKSLARRITSIKAFFRWLHQTGRTVVDPAEKVLQQSVISPLPVVLTEDEVGKIYETANAYRMAKKPDARMYVLAALLLETGIKKGESLALNLNHIDLTAPDGPTLFVRYPNQRNRYKERKILLTSAWVEAYQEYLVQYDKIVKEEVFPWSPRRLEYLLEDLGNAAGLNKHLSFDMCRWTSALIDWRAGVDSEQIRQKMGISKIQWREIHLKLRQLAGDRPVSKPD